MELSGKRVVVVGLGKSGVAAAKLCLARGARVTGTDSASADSPPATIIIQVMASGVIRVFTTARVRWMEILRP